MGEQKKPKAEVVKTPAKKKKVGGKLGDIMAKLNQQKGGNDIGKAPSPSPRKARKKINPNLMKNIPMPGTKPPGGASTGGGAKKKPGKLNANFMKGIPMPGMGAPPRRKKKPVDPSKMDENT